MRINKQTLTTEKNQQEILEKDEQKFRLLTDSMPQQVWTALPDGQLTYYNKSVFEYSGMTYEEISEKGWIEIVHPEDREKNINK